MAITGIGYGRTLMYEIQKRVSEGTLQSASDVASRFAESLEESAEENDKVLAPVTRGVRLNPSYRRQRQSALWGNGGGRCY